MSAIETVLNERGAVTEFPERTRDFLQLSEGDGKTRSRDHKLYLLRTVAALPDGGHDYLVKGLFAPCEMSVIYGEPGSGKSFLAAFLAYCIALGRSLFDRWVRRAPVVYAALEGQIGFARRLRALRDTFGASDQFFWLDQSVDLFSGEGDVDGLIDAVLKANAKLLVIDTLARALGVAAKMKAGTWVR